MAARNPTSCPYGVSWSGLAPLAVGVAAPAASTEPSALSATDSPRCRQWKGATSSWLGRMASVVASLSHAPSPSPTDELYRQMRTRPWPLGEGAHDWW